VTAGVRQSGWCRCAGAPAAGLSVLLLLLNSAPAWAAQPLIEVQTRVQRGEGWTEIGLTLWNTSNQPILQAEPILELAGASARPEVVDTIPVGSRASWTYRFADEELELSRPGVHPLSVTIQYHDWAMFPYSVVDLSQVEIGQSQERPELEAQLSALGSSELLLQLRNTGAEAIPLQVRLVLPVEIQPRDGRSDLRLEAGETRELAFEIDNQRAVPGSIYRVFAVIEYLREDVNRSVIASTDLSVTAPPWPDRRFPLRELGILSLVSAVFVAIAVGELRSRRGKE